MEDGGTDFFVVVVGHRGGGSRCRPHGAVLGGRERLPRSGLRPQDDPSDAAPLVGGTSAAAARRPRGACTASLVGRPPACQRPPQTAS